jgi:DNA-binding NarL/FixJ family response regulator/tetratricopeptide (TPR) repeat protein
VQIDSSVRPTVGRDSELEQLEAALEALAQEGSVCVAVEGEPGIGKTRLLVELQSRAEERGHVVLTGSATEFERDLPFSVWVDALDAYVASQELGLQDEWDADAVDELAEVIPSLRRSDGGARSSVADERYRAHRAVRRLLELLAADRPLVIVLDDLHWSDGASIELLGALLRRGPDAPVLLALAFRRGQAPARLSAALATPSTRRIALEQLDEAQATELLAELDPQAAAEIYRRGGGNPFYLEQLARAGDGETFAATSSGNGTGVDGSGIPAAVAASLAEELASLSAADSMLLEAAAVAGEPFEPDLAAVIAELPTSEGLTALDALLELDLVRPTAVPRRFVFRHPLVRRAVYEGAPGGWRLAAHARAASELAARGAAAGERAHHVEQSAAQGDDDAIALLFEAGEAAAPRAPAVAVRWFEATLRLLRASDKRQVDVRVALASALRAVGELERCRATLLEAIELLSIDERERHVELTTLCAAVEHWLGRHEEAHHRLVRAWDDLPDRFTAAAAALQIELTVDGLYQLDFEQTGEMGREALESARAVGDRALVAAAASALCLGETVVGRIPAARGYRNDAQGEVDRLTDAELAPRLEALYYLGWAETYLELYEDSVAHFERGVEIARAIGDGRLLIPLMLGKNFTLEMQGRLAEAIECCETAVEAVRLSSSPHELYRALFEWGWTLYYAGDLDGAITAFEESLRVDPRLAGGTIPNAGGGPGWGLGVAWFEAGEVERGRKILLQLGEEDVVRTMPVERCFDWETLTLVELAVGNVTGAGEYASRAEEDAAKLGLQLPAALASRARAAVLLAAGEPHEAAQLAARSAAEAEAIGASLHVAFSHSLQGRALAAAGERSKAIAMLRQAEQELDACGSVRVRDETRRELRRLGARAEPRGPSASGESGIASLTKRELEIAELATDRKTNREIAAELFLSGKTVESHMRNIFNKLGVSSRVEVARAIEHDRRARDEAHA